ncbi:hypothetical protein Esti_002408 [Eimeria stiedai]
MCARLATRYWWPRLRRDVCAFLRRCTFNLAVADSPMGWKGLTLRIGCPFEGVGTDWFGPLPQTRAGNTYILVIVDHHTRWVELVPLEAPTAAAGAEAFLLHASAVRAFPAPFLSNILGAAALAYRATPYCVSKFTPYFLVTGQEVVLALSRSWNDPTVSLSGERWHNPLLRCRLTVHQRITAANLRRCARTQSVTLNACMCLFVCSLMSGRRGQVGFRLPGPLCRYARLPVRAHRRDLCDLLRASSALLTAAALSSSIFEPSAAGILLCSRLD